MNSQIIQDQDGESKAVKRKSTRRRRPNLYTNDWADTSALPINTWQICKLTSGWSLERTGALMRFVHVVWSTQAQLPSSIASITTQELRGIYRMERRTATRMLDAEMRRVVDVITAKRAPLCEGGREWVFEKSNGRCHHCEVVLDPDCFHVDHLIPVARGGLTHNDNLVASCPPCNLSKGGRVP